MNAEQLLTHFDRIANAPDAIPRLRRFILDLAVRSKLVEQDPNDEPALELLKRIAVEKENLLTAGKIRKPKQIKSIKADDTEFWIPSCWRWTRLGEITSYIQRGKSPKYASGDGSLVISQKCVQWHGLDLDVARKITYESLSAYEDIRFLRDGDLLWNSTGTGTIGRVVRIVDALEKLVCDSHVTVVRCLLVNPEYVRTWLRSGAVYGSIEDRAAGSTNQVELTAGIAINQMVPLPPLAEQHRIVAKVDELMALCDRLEEARMERKTTRDRLTAASLARLDAPDPDPGIFQSHVSFALDNLIPLTTRPDQIKALRQTILNLAVRGKLVPQDPNDEPAAELLKRIAEEKRRLVKAGKIRKKPLILNDKRGELDFPIPASWMSVRLAEISNIVMGQSPPGHTYNTFGEGVPLINGPVEFSQGPFGKTVVNQYTTAPTNYCDKGDFLICVRGSTTGRSNIAAFEACIGRGVAAIQPLFDDGFVRFFLWSMREQIINMGRGIAFPSITRKQLENFPVPLPPLAEQHRIVAKVDKLMAVCDGLEASLANSDDDRRRLLDALLHEGLAEMAAPERSKGHHRCLV